MQTYGRDSLNYAPGLERSLVISKEQIMALPNLHGYWKYGDAVVPFRIEPIDRPKLAHAFLPRQSRPLGQPEPQKIQAEPHTSAIGNGQGQEREKKLRSLPTTMSISSTLRF